MSSSHFFHDASGKAIAAIEFDALYAHPYKVGIIFRTSTSASSDASDFAVRAAVKVSYEEFESFAGWVKGKADSYAKEGFLNKRVWPINFAKHAKATARPLQDPVVIQQADGTRIHVALNGNPESPGAFVLTLISVSPDNTQRSELLRIPMTHEEANELAIHMAIKRYSQSPTSGLVK
jgi:hypothetical protein